MYRVQFREKNSRNLIQHFEIDHNYLLSHIYTCSCKRIFSGTKSFIRHLHKDQKKDAGFSKSTERIESSSRDFTIHELPYKKPRYKSQNNEVLTNLFQEKNDGNSLKLQKKVTIL